MIPLVNARVITEVEAFRILFGLDAIHVGGGGVNGSEGSVTLVAEGEKKALDQAIKLIESIKGESPLGPKKSLCLNCLPTAASTTKSPDEQFAEKKKKYCMFQGNKEDDLPDFFQQRGSTG
jgi:hypothetical protein